MFTIVLHLYYKKVGNTAKRFNYIILVIEPFLISIVKKLILRQYYKFYF